MYICVAVYDVQQEYNRHTNQITDCEDIGLFLCTYVYGSAPCLVIVRITHSYTYCKGNS